MLCFHNPAACLEHADFELDRLSQQADFWRSCSEDFLQQAGIVPGMRVLEVGSGAGDLAFLAAEFVGRGGSVVSVDSSPLAIARSVYRAADMGFTNVRFIHSDIDSFDMNRYKLYELFDAVIGRTVLMHLPAPAYTLQRLSAWVAPGGTIAFQELDMGAAASDPVLPVFAQAMRWINETYRQASIPISLGRHLHEIYTSACLPAPTVVPACRWAGQYATDSADPIFDYVANTVHTLLPLMERLGIATHQQVEIDTLSMRLRDEALQRHATIVPPTLVGAWSRIAGG